MSARSLVQDSGAPAWLSTASGRYRRSQSRFRASSGIQCQQVFDRFPPDQRRDLAITNGDDRRPGDVVVVARHGAAVRARAWHGEQVAGSYVRWKELIRTRMSPPSQCLPTTRASTGGAAERREAKVAEYSAA